MTALLAPYDSFVPDESSAPGESVALDESFAADDTGGRNRFLKVQVVDTGKRNYIMGAKMSVSRGRGSRNRISGARMSISGVEFKFRRPSGDIGGQNQILETKISMSEGGILLLVPKCPPTGIAPHDFQPQGGRGEAAWNRSSGVWGLW